MPPRQQVFMSDHCIHTRGWDPCLIIIARLWIAAAMRDLSNFGDTLQHRGLQGQVG